MDIANNHSNEGSEGLTIEPPHWDLRIVWIVAFGSLVLAFPFYSSLVFLFDKPRDGVADIFSIHVAFAYWVGISAAFLPLPSLRSWSRFQRIQTVALTFMIASFATHLSWELLWVLFHDVIAQSRDSIWAYTWWAYIDGGDVRYFHAESHFVMLEIISVINGSVGVCGLLLLKRSGFNDYRGTLMCMATAVTHTVTTWYYFGTEILTGFASVNTSSFVDLWIKFVFLNAPWLVFPWFVLWWGKQTLQQQLKK